MAKSAATNAVPFDDEQQRQQALSRKGWSPIGGGSGTIRKWEEGMEIEGRFSGVRDGTRGPNSKLVDIETKLGVVETFGCPAILQSRLSGVTLGMGLNIKCVGKVPSKRGTDAWNFVVYSTDQLELPTP